MADCDDLTEPFLAVVDEAFSRLLDEPDAHLHVNGFAPAACAEPQSLVKVMTAASWMVVRINSWPSSSLITKGLSASTVHPSLRSSAAAPLNGPLTWANLIVEVTLLAMTSHPCLNSAKVRQ